jgi:ribonuclease J
MQGARIYDEVHVSGHLRQEGLYQMLDTLQPKHVIPAHQDMAGYAPYVRLAEEEGYKMGRDLHVSRNGNRIQLVE